MDPEDLPDMSAFDRARSGQPVRIRAGFRAVEPLPPLEARRICVYLFPAAAEGLAAERPLH